MQPVKIRKAAYKWLLSSSEKGTYFEHSLAFLSLLEGIFEDNNPKNIAAKVNLNQPKAEPMKVSVLKGKSKKMHSDEVEKERSELKQNYSKNKIAVATEPDYRIRICPDCNNFNLTSTVWNVIKNQHIEIIRKSRCGDNGSIFLEGNFWALEPNFN